MATSSLSCFPPSARVRAFVVTALVSIAAGVGPAFGQGGAPPGLNREQMWFAPTADDWKKPCLIKWQRTLDDGKAVSKETGKPLLIVVNMDGEIASEHYAGVRYRQPEIAKLYEGYVCVIASTYRHSPRDADENGQRVLCPRFGGVTCAEHIAVEGLIYDTYEGRQRVAPRHIGVELDGKPMYDVFYAWDTDTIFNTVKDGTEKRSADLLKPVKGDRSLMERITSRDNIDRTAVESAWADGDSSQRRALLQAAIKNKDATSLDLLRMAIFGFDPELAQMARAALAESSAEGAADLIADALRVPLEPKERETMVAALARLGESNPRAQTLAVAQRGLAARSEVVNVEHWAGAIEDVGDVGRARYTGSSRTRALSVHAEPRNDPKAAQAALERKQKTLEGSEATPHVELAEALLAKALLPETPRETWNDLFTEAHATALKAEKLGAFGERVNTVAAVASYYLGRADEARERALLAVSTPSKEPEGFTAMIVLGLFAEARQEAIRAAMKDKKPWPSAWLTDVHAAYAVLSRHPEGTDAQVAAHYDFLHSLGASGQAYRILDEGLAHFPDSGELHNRLRCKILREQGVDGLEKTYERMLQRPESSKSLEWFAGYASLLAADYHRRGGALGKALGEFGRAIQHFDLALQKNPDNKESADHFAALALGGRARIAFEQKDDERAVKEVLASFARKPTAAATLDGLNISPVDTAKMLLTRLKDAKKDSLASELDAALGKLDPALLALPAYERGGEAPPPAPPGRRPGRRGGG